MVYVLQVDFKMNGPFGDEMAEVFLDLAKSINEEEALCGKSGQNVPKQMKPVEFIIIDQDIQFTATAYKF